MLATLCLWLDDHLADDFPLLNHAQPFQRLGKRQHAVDHGLERALRHHRHEGREILVIKTVRANDFQFKGPDVAQIFWWIIAGRGAAHENAPTAFDTAQGRVPGVTPSKIDHHIDTPCVRAPLWLAISVDHPLREIDFLVVEHVISAKLLEPLELCRTTGAGDDLSPEHFAEDDAARAHPATGPEDHDPVPLLNGLVGDQHAMGCAIGHWEGGSHLEGHRFRHTQQLIGSNAAILRHTAIEHFSHEALVRMDGVNQDTVPWLPLGHAWPRLDHFPS